MNRPCLPSRALGALGAFGLLVLTPGCPLLEAEVHVPEVCIAYDEIEVGAVPAVSRRFVVDDLAEIHELTDHAEHLSFRRGEVIALSGIADFDFVETARIAISPGDGETGVAPLTLYACAGDCVSRADSLALTAAEEHDVLEYLRADQVAIDLELTGALPPHAWTMSVVVCFEGTARYEVSP